ncbi:MAG: nicotinamide mononucleotide transporter [Sedimentisphaerales bacterium]|nr:nicotinamide mononucleotide transporter [Sedimentisphaerales bacterium]
MRFLNVDNAFFTVLGYPMSYIELTATLLIVVYVLLITKKIVWAWPLGLINFSLFAVLFYQVRLYSDFFEQFYYIGNCFYGWWVWLSAWKKAGGEKKELEVSFATGKARFIAGAIIVGVSIVTGFTMSRIHTWLPALFTQPAAYPYIDALATITGFVAAALMAHRKIEAWLLWICVDVICIGLYYARNVKFVAVLYIFFLTLALNGLITWGKELRIKKTQH